MQSTDRPLQQYISALASQLVCLPGHPEHGAFYLINGLIQVVKTHNWYVVAVCHEKLWCSCPHRDKGAVARAEANLRLLGMLSAMAQPKLPYGYDDIAGNDVLYAGDPDYMEELNGLLDDLIEGVMQALAELKENSDASVLLTAACASLFF